VTIVYPWPELDLTDAEREFVRYYADETKPGVLRRTYKVLLANAAIAAAQITQPQTIQNVQISRRARVFGLTFAGDVSMWYLDVQSASGRRLTPPNPLAAQLTPPNPPGCLVSSMFPGTPWDVNAQVGAFPGAAVLGIDQWQSGPLILEPNFVLVPNETLIFTGTPVPPAFAPDAVLALEIGVHVWEFPDMAGR
jgi:hypothetical protein